MDGIYYKDGIYVTIDNKEKNDNCLFYKVGRGYSKTISLFGGRVEISSTNWKSILKVDGISVVNIENKLINENLPFLTITSHLNAIETNGVDAFLEHYKKSLEFIYSELKELNQKTESQLTVEHEDLKIKNILSELTELRDLLFSVLIILFSLSTYMSAGLENEKVISVCQSIMDSLA